MAGKKIILEVVNKAVASAVEKGIVVVVSAGNKDHDACFNTPALEPTAITVGATDQFDKISRFTPPKASNFGPCVDVYAPGSLIKSAYMRSTTFLLPMSGTSMAAPCKFFSLF